MQLRGDTITFNGINSSKFGLYLCTVDGGVDYYSRKFGTERSITSESGVIKTIEGNKETLDLQLVKLDNKYKPMPLRDDELEEISRWLFSPQEYKPLMVDNKGVVYYGIFTSGDIWQNEYDKGYLTLKFELNTDHAYSVLQNSTFRVNGTKQIQLTSRHTYSQYNEIDIELKIASGSSFTIFNRTTGQRMELKNLPSECTHIYIYNEGVKHIENMDDKEQNLRPYFNKVFIHLAYGVNNITIQGQGIVRFISQGKVLLN